MSDASRLEKDKIRKKILLKRKDLLKSAVNDLSGIISRKVLSIKKIKSAKTYLVYLPINNEVDTKFIINFLIQNQKKIFVPAYIEKSWVIGRLKNLDDLKRNQLKTLQPKKIIRADISEIDVAFVPGIAFDKNGVRLGYGKGVYDRLLAGFSGAKIGLAYDFQIVDKIPKENHDLLMDKVISEKRNLAVVRKV